MLAQVPPRIVIAGGGISGLAAAHRLASAAQDCRPQVRLFEATSRCGGQIRTAHEAGFLIEGGPDSVVEAKPAGLRLCEATGLDDERIHPRPGASGIEVVRGGRLARLPAGFSPLLGPSSGAWLGSPVLSWRGKLRVLGERFARSAESAEDESVRALVTRRFGRELLERVVEPVLGGLYAADVGRLSADIVLPQLREAERSHGSIAASRSRVPPAGAPGAARTVFSLRRGMQAIADAVAERLPLGTVARTEPVETLLRDPATGMWWVRTSAAHGLPAAAVILALPAFESARLLREIDPPLAEALGELRYASCATVSLAYPRSALAREPASYGFFVPHVERLPILACSYSSLKFEGRCPAELVLLRVFAGGALDERVLERDDAALATLAHDTLARLLSIRTAPVRAWVHRSPASMPQYEVGDRERRARIAARLERLPGLFLCGSAIGAYGIPDCIDTGTRAADAALAQLRAVHGAELAAASARG